MLHCLIAAAIACLFAVPVGMTPAFANTPPAATTAARALPDFTSLVDSQSPAVVNISTTQAVRRPTTAPQIPGIEDEELQEFFRRFIPRQPGPGQGPRAESRSLGSPSGERSKWPGIRACR